MNKVYVLYCEQWGGNSYYQELITVFKDEELARRTALSMQQGHKLCDSHYLVQEVEFDGFEP